MEGMTTTSASGSGALKGDWKPTGTFNGVPYFECDSDTFYKCVQGKQKGKHWRKFLGGEFGEGVRQWVSKNRTSNFMLRNKDDGSFIYAHKNF
jgi:hypothetical protein